MLNLQPLSVSDSLEKISEKSHSNPVMIFKHSTRCGVSFSALDTLSAEWDHSKVEGMDTYILDVIRDREYAREVGSYFKTPHQSPQVLLIKNGEVVYEQSHFGINFGELEDAMSKLNAG